jgi:hypothetical protein
MAASAAIADGRPSRLYRLAVSARRPCTRSGRLSLSGKRYSESGEAPSLQKQLADIFQQDRPLPLGGFVGFGSCTPSIVVALLRVGTVPVTGGGQETVNLADGVHAKAYDLSPGIDTMCEKQI